MSSPAGGAGSQPREVMPVSVLTESELGSEAQRERRKRILDATLAIASKGGFEAVRHRAVARRAGLPLASTTYYFSSLDELVGDAVEYIGATEAAHLRQRVQGLPRRRRGAEPGGGTVTAAPDGGPGLVDLQASKSASRRDTIRHP